MDSRFEVDMFINLAVFIILLELFQGRYDSAKGEFITNKRSHHRIAYRFENGAALFFDLLEQNFKMIPDNIIGTHVTQFFVHLG